MEVRSKGVDSTGSGFVDPASTVRLLALKEREHEIKDDFSDHLTRSAIIRQHRRHDWGRRLGIRR